MNITYRFSLAVLTLLILITGVIVSSRQPILATSAFKAAESSADEVIKMEKQWWDAYKNHNVSWYRENVKLDAILVNPSGRHTKADMVDSAASPRCEVNSFTLSDFHTITLAEGIVLLSYRAEEDTTCEGHKSASKVYGTTIYAKEDGRWLVAFAQETAIPE